MSAANDRERRTQRQAFRRWREWRALPLGILLAQAERAELDVILPDLFGYHVLQLSASGTVDLLEASRITHKIIADPDAVRAPAGVGLVADMTTLPVAGDSIDVAVLPHTLELVHHPHHVLREVQRILMPEGYLIIIAFNPFSLWGLWRLLHRHSARLPWSGRFYTLTRVKDWLALLGFDTVHVRHSFFRPPLRHIPSLQRLSFLERWGTRFWPLGSAVYIVVARKRVATLTPIRPRWRPRRWVGARAADV